MNCRLSRLSWSSHLPITALLFSSGPPLPTLGEPEPNYSPLPNPLFALLFPLAHSSALTAQSISFPHQDLNFDFPGSLNLSGSRSPPKARRRTDTIFNPRGIDPNRPSAVRPALLRAYLLRTIELRMYMILHCCSQSRSLSLAASHLRPGAHRVCCLLLAAASRSPLCPLRFRLPHSRGSRIAQTTIACCLPPSLPPGFLTY